VFFYMAALVLEMAALIRLRRLAPDRKGKFTIGGGRAGLILAAVLPTLTWIATFGLAISAGDVKSDFVIAVALSAGVWPAYWFCRWRYGGPPKVDPPPTSITA
ncbi:MAG TPA: hypothetical protein VMT58_06525, partial [Candidatus Binataceae bacterium]|nr:hypothetical protein [Candidatus Binataceae bacterium]